MPPVAAPVTGRPLLFDAGVVLGVADGLAQSFGFSVSHLTASADWPFSLGTTWRPFTPLKVTVPFSPPLTVRVLASPLFGVKVAVTVVVPLVLSIVKISESQVAS